MTTHSTAVRPVPETLFLRRALAADSAVTTVNGLAYLLLAGPVGDLLDVSSGLLAGLGGALALYGGAVGWLATRSRPPVRAVRVVIEANVLWAAASLVVLALGWLSPSTAGAVWIPLQAAVVGGFAALQQIGLRRYLPGQRRIGGRA